MSARRSALRCLRAWDEGSRYAEDLLREAARDLEPRDRGLAMELVYGSIRHLLLLDAYIGALRDGPLRQETRWLLRLGLAQLFVSDLPPHAAVHETVALARPRERGLVNAVLRSALRRREELEALAASLPEWQRLSHPEFLLERWRAEHGPETASAYAAWNNQPPPAYGRINPLAADRAALAAAEAEIAAAGLFLGPEHPGFFRIEGAPPAEWLAAGLVYVQDPATALACRLLSPRSGETVLDACAAPGGKTALLAAIAGGGATIHATDASAARLRRARGNLDRLGLSEVRTEEIDWEAVPEERLGALPRYDAILLDAPCSNTGVVRRRVDVRWRLRPEDFARHADAQARLLGSLRRVLKPGGRLVYSTCSIDREENEAVAAASGMRLVAEARSLPWLSDHDGAYAAMLKE